MVHYYCNNIWINTFFNINNLSKMKLTEEQKNQILNLYEGLKNDEQTLGEVLEVIVDFCVDESMVDLTNDKDGDLLEEFSNEVWDYLETIA